MSAFWFRMSERVVKICPSFPFLPFLDLMLQRGWNPVPLSIVVMPLAPTSRGLFHDTLSVFPSPFPFRGGPTVEVAAAPAPGVWRPIISLHSLWLGIIYRPQKPSPSSSSFFVLLLHTPYSCRRMARTAISRFTSPQLPPQAFADSPPHAQR